MEDAERDIMEMQMRVLTARRSHANSSNAATEYRKAVSDYNSAIRLGESKDNPLQKPAFDLLATAHVCLGHLRLVYFFLRENTRTILRYLLLHCFGL